MDDDGDLSGNLPSSASFLPVGQKRLVYQRGHAQASSSGLSDAELRIPMCFYLDQSSRLSRDRSFTSKCSNLNASSSSFCV